MLFNYVKSINDKNNKIKNAALIFLQTFLRNSFEKPGNIFAQKYIKSPKKKLFRSNIHCFIVFICKTEKTKFCALTYIFKIQDYNCN